MKFNLYHLKDSNLETSNYKIPSITHQKLERIESEIIKEYLEAQKNKVGITKLGQRIRYNDAINETLNYSDKEHNVLIKLTENKRSFLRVLLDALHNFSKSSIYFLILEEEFGKESRLVDNSFIKINEIQEELNILFTHFSPNHSLPNIYFIEFKGFNQYRIEVSDKYSKIHKNG